MRLSYLMADDPPTVLHTLDRGPFIVQETVVAMNFPICPSPRGTRSPFWPGQAGMPIVVLGVFPVSFPRKAGVVELGDDGRSCARRRAGCPQGILDW